MKRTTNSSRLRVLLVEDNPDTADTLQMLVSRWGHDVRVVSDGPAALEVAPVYCPQLVLLDIGLPGMDGWQVAAAMREHPAMQKALLLALTGYGQESDFKNSIAAGCHGHLVKPVDPQELEAILDRVAYAISAGW